MSKSPVTMSRYVLVKMHRMTASSDSNYCPFMEECDGSNETWELFQLNDEGQWVQEHMPPLIYHSDEDERSEKERRYCNMIYGKSDSENPAIDEELEAIKGFEGGDGERLLCHLNKETKRQQLENGVNASDVIQGTVILNSIDQVIFTLIVSSLIVSSEKAH